MDHTAGSGTAGGGPVPDVGPDRRRPAGPLPLGGPEATFAAGADAGVPGRGIAAVPRLLIVDHAPTRLGIRLALRGEAEICAEADDGDQAIRAAKRAQPDVALVGAGISPRWRRVVEGIVRAAPSCAVVVLSQLDDPDDMLEAVRAGALGYVPGALDADSLRRVVRAASQQEAAVPRGMVVELLKELRCGADETLTGREAQVLAMLRRGHSTASIAERLEIAPVTVRRHISELVRKLGLDSRADLIGV